MASVFVGGSSGLLANPCYKTLQRGACYKFQAIGALLPKERKIILELFIFKVVYNLNSPPVCTAHTGA